MTLYDQAVRLGTASPGDLGRLDFVSLAERAKRVSKTPPKLFAWLLQRQKHNFIAGRDEDRASLAIKAHQAKTEFFSSWGRSTKKAEEPTMQTTKPRRSHDAVIVDAAIQISARINWPGEPFDMLRRDKPHWSRARWDAATAEIDRLGSVPMRISNLDATRLKSKAERVAAVLFTTAQ